MKNLGWYNGKYDLLENMTIPFNDRVNFFGDGVYDAMTSRNYIPFPLDEHIDRFFRSAAMIDIEIPVTKQELHDLILDLMKKLDTDVQFVYFQVTRGTAEREHTYTKGPGNLWVVLKPSSYNTGEEPVQLITHEDKRYKYCNIKTLNLLPSVLYAQAAKEAGCFEAILYREGGRVTECAHSNCHIIKDGILRTAPTDELILPGIGRAHLLKAARKLGIPVDETPFMLDDVFTADEVLVTSSSNFCIHADMVDGKPVGMKAPEIFEALRKEVVDEFMEYTKKD